MIVRVFIGMHMAVVLMVLGVKLRVPKGGVKESAGISDQVIERFIWRNSAVHGIVCGDEQAGIQVHLQQNKQVKQRVGKVHLPVH